MTTGLHTGFRWYNDLDKQNQYKEYCNECSFKLISKPNSFLPFILRARPTDDVGNITIYCADDDSELTTINSAYLSKTIIGAYDYISYNGEDITGLVLECGTYYARILTDNEAFYSEIFTVVDFEEPALLPNGDFSGLGSWEQVGESSDWSWTIEFDAAYFTKIEPASVSGIFSNQIPPYLLIRAGVTYRVKYTIGPTSFGFGDFNFKVIVGGTDGAVRTSVGTYIETIEASENGYFQLYVEKTDAGIGNIRVDNISIEAFVPDDAYLFTAWRWYNNQQKQNIYKEYCGPDCGFNLISFSDTLPTFIFRYPQIEGEPNIQSWILRNEDCEVQLDESLINSYESQDGQFVYIFFNGESSPMELDPLVLPNGDFSTGDNWVELDENNAQWEIEGGAIDRAKFTSQDGFGSSVFSNSDDSPLEIVAGNVYVVTYTITTFSGEDVFFAIRVGDTEGEHRTTSGTYTETITALNDGFVELYAETESDDPSQITVDNVTISLAEPIPCGVYESVLTINGVEYFSEWIQVMQIETPDVESSYLLQEDGFRILQENGLGILLE